MVRLPCWGSSPGSASAAPADLSVTINACLGAAIALGVSGVSSAYVSESAERRRALGELEAAMATDLLDSAHGEAARRVPMLIALVNGAAPLLISLLIILPLWLAHAGLPLPVIRPLALPNIVAQLIFSIQNIQNSIR